MLDSATRTLYRYGEPVALPPKSFECIVYLMENHDRAVGRDELISAVWGRVDASDAVVAQTLLRARRAINDTGDRQSRIRTVPRYGYQWVGEFEKEAPADPKADPAARTATASSATGTGAPRRNLGWPVFAIAILAVAVLITVALNMGSPTEPPTVDTGEPGLTAVLPVSVAPDTPETAWIRLGAMDYIASRLREQPGLRVLPSSRTLSLLGDESVVTGTAAYVRDTTGARYVLVPTAIAENGGWRFRITLDGDSDPQVVELVSDTPLGAAAAASDMLLRRLGLDGTALPEPNQLTERLQQVDAELLAGQLANARGLIATAPETQQGHPQLLVRQGQVEFRAGQLDVARSIFENLLGGSAELPPDVRARALMGLGAVALRQSRFDESESRYEQALSLLRDSGYEDRDPALVGNAYNGRGVSRVELGRAEDGIADLGRARIAMVRAGDVVEAATVGANIGLLEARRHHPARAIQEFDKAIETFDRFGVRDNLAAVLSSKARAELQLLQPRRALEDSTRAMSIGADLENPRLLRAIRLAHTEALLAMGRLTEAERMLTEDDDVTPVLRLKLALERGDFDASLQLARDLLESENPVPADAALLGIQAGHLAGDPELVAASQAWFAQQGEGEPASFESAFADALAAWFGGNSVSMVDAAFARTLDSELMHMTPVDEVRAGAARVIALVEAGRMDRASEIMGSFSPYAEHDYRAARAALALYLALGDHTLVDTAAARVADLAGERNPELPVIF